MLNFIIIGGMVLAAADLFSTIVFDYPIIKPGPMAKAMYPGIENTTRCKNGPKTLLRICKRFSRIAN